MSILNYIEKIKQENEGPRITAQEPRNNFNAGGGADVSPLRIDDNFWINHYRQVIDARLGAMEAVRKRGDPQNPDDAEYLFEQYNKLKKYGGDVLEFDQRIRDLSPLAEEPEFAAHGGRIGLDGGGALTMDVIRVLQDKQNFRDAWKNYKKSTRGSRPLSSGQFFEIWSRENMATGGSAGQLVRNTVDGSRPGYGGTNAKTNQGFQVGNPGNIKSLEHKNTEALKIKLQKFNRAKELLKQGKSKAETMRIIVNEFNLTRDPYAGTTPWMRQAADEIINEGGTIKAGTTTEGEGAKKRGAKKRYKLDKDRSSVSIQRKIRAPVDSGLNLTHAGGKYTQVGLHNLIYAEGSANRRMVKPFEDKIFAEMDKFYKVYNNPDTPDKFKRLAGEEYLKADRALRKKYPEYAKLKTRLSFKNTPDSKLSSFAVTEKLPNPKLAISNEPDMLLKGETPTSEKGKKIIELSKKSLEAKIKELGGKEKLNKLLFEGGGTKVERGLIQRIVSGGGKFALSMLNPRELIRLSNLVGPAALGLMAAYEAGSITDDVLRLNKPLDEALAGNWLTKSFLPYSEEFAKQKNLLQSEQLTGSQREYALEMMKMEEFMKEGQRIVNLEANKLVEGTLDDDFIFTSQEKMNKAYQGMFERIGEMKPYIFEEGITGRSLENEAAMNEYQDSRLAKTGEYTSAVSEDKFRLPGQRQIKRDENYEFASSPIFGGPQRLVNKAPRPKNIGRGPMTEKGRMKLDFSIPGYTPYDKVYTPSNDEILNYYKKQGIRHPRFGQLEPGEGTGIRMDLASRDGNRSIYGAGQKMATGGLAGLMKKYYD